MAKCILMSIKPQYVSMILNKIKTLEIRKRFPSDYVGWVYIYCTKEQGLARLYNGRWNDTFVCEKDVTDNEFKRMYSGYDGKGKVVARFWCGKVEEIKGMFDELNREYAFENEKDLLNKSCLESDELGDYLKIYNNNDYEKVGYAIHITKLEIFNKPKELREFKYYKKFSEIDYMLPIPRKETCERLVALTRAPQSYCFIEV